MTDQHSPYEPPQVEEIEGDEAVTTAPAIVS
jgi:hypothetical protein